MHSPTQMGIVKAYLNEYCAVHNRTEYVLVFENMCAFPPEICMFSAEICVLKMAKYVCLGAENMLVAVCPARLGQGKMRSPEGRSQSWCRRVARYTPLPAPGHAPRETKRY